MAPRVGCCLPGDILNIQLLGYSGEGARFRGVTSRQAHCFPVILVFYTGCKVSALYLFNLFREETVVKK